MILLHWPQETNHIISQSDVNYPVSDSGQSNHEMTSISVMSPASNMLETVIVHHQPDCHVLAKHKLTGANGDMFNTSNKQRWIDFVPS